MRIFVSFILSLFFSTVSLGMQNRNNGEVANAEATEYVAQQKQRGKLDAFCFSAGTLVTTRHGLVSIEEVEPGDEIVSQHFEGQQSYFRGVNRVFRSFTDQIVRIHIAGKMVEATPNHPFYLPTEKSFVPAEELNIGDKLLALDGSMVEIEKLETVDLETPIEIFNLEGDIDHNYYVSYSNSSSGILVHNCENAGEFASGVAVGASESLPGASQHPPRGSRMFEQGRKVGQVASGTAQVVVGASGVAAGEALAGVSCIGAACVGVPAGAAVAGAGAALVGHGASVISDTIMRKESQIHAQQLTRDEARREVMREEGIPTSQQPISQSQNPSGREYRYEVKTPGGKKEIKSVQEQTLDSSHPGQGHWEAGTVKTDPITGEVRMNKYDRPKLENDKSKVDFHE